MRFRVPGAACHVGAGFRVPGWLLDAGTTWNDREDKKENIETKLFVSGDQDSVAVEGNTIKALKPGKVNVFVTHTFNMHGKEWNLVAEPIEVEIQ